jgi:hypothetical protein
MVGSVCPTTDSETWRSEQAQEHPGREKTADSRFLAEGVGFEPTVPLQARRFSRPVP